MALYIPHCILVCQTGNLWTHPPNEWEDGLTKSPW